MTVTLLLLTAASLFLSLVLTPVARALALRWNLVDQPDNKRKVHKRPIPRIGGVPLAIAYFSSCLGVGALLSGNDIGGHIYYTAVRAIAPAAALVFLVGLADDIFNLRPWHKLAVEIVAAMMVVSSGIDIPILTSIPVPNVVGMIGTVLWLLACTNAINLIDGLDGLAAGIALLATATTLIAAILSGHWELAVAAAPLVGALLGFLVFNFNPASIFLGDSGSLLLGFLLGCYSMLWSAKTATVLGMTAPLMALSVPLLDTTLAIARRFLRAQPIFKADQSHIHHRLLARGLRHRDAVLMLYVAAAAAGFLSLGLIWARNHLEAVILLTFVIGAVFAIRQLGYAEFSAARRMILAGGFRRELNSKLALESFEEKLAAALTARDCWTVIQTATQDFGLQASRMQLDRHVFEGESGLEADVGLSWAIRVAIPENGWIDLSPARGATHPVQSVIQFVDVIRRVLPKKVWMPEPVKETDVFVPLLAGIGSHPRWIS